MSFIYGREALRRLRERQERAVQEAELQPSLLEQVPPDAPTDDATITAWDGARFVAYERWLASAPLAIEEERREDGNRAIPADATCLAGDCAGARIWLVKDGERWLMFVGARKPKNRRRDFASPFLEHSIRTAEGWYGAPGGGWCAEKGSDARKTEAADLPPQDPTDEEATGKRGNDDLDLGGQ